jgi:hypothetical protein
MQSKNSSPASSLTFPEVQCYLAVVLDYCKAGDLVCEDMRKKGMLFGWPSSESSSNGLFLF